MKHEKSHHVRCEVSDATGKPYAIDPNGNIMHVDELVLLVNELQDECQSMKDRLATFDGDIAFDQITCTNVENTPQTQCNYILHGLDKDGRVWEQRNTDSIWRPVPIWTDERRK
tara:strand:+ start:2297 stop:2638 length:342 start_codon:yes stop_codon:yes gene_type:complete